MNGEDAKPLHYTECGARGAGDDGLCKPCRIGQEHGPEARQRYFQDLARKGARAARAKRQGFSTHDLPALDSPQAADVWLAKLARAVLEKRISKGLASEARKMLNAHDRGTTSERLDELMEALAEWRQTGDPAPVLELVEGGKGTAG